VADPAELDGALLALRELPSLHCVRVTAVNFSIAGHQVRRERVRAAAGVLEDSSDMDIVAVHAAAVTAVPRCDA